MSATKGTSGLPVLDAPGRKRWLAAAVGLHGRVRMVAMMGKSVRAFTAKPTTLSDVGGG